MEKIAIYLVIPNILCYFAAPNGTNEPYQLLKL